MQVFRAFLLVLIFSAIAVAGERLGPSPSGNGTQYSPADGTLTENVVDTFEVEIMGMTFQIPYVKRFTLDGRQWEWDDENENYEEVGGDDTIDMGAPDQYGVTPYTMTDNPSGAGNHSSVLAPQ